MIPRVRFGRTGLEVTRIALCCFPFGGVNKARGWDPFTPEGRSQAVETVHAALDAATLDPQHLAARELPHALVDSGRGGEVGVGQVMVHRPPIDTPALVREDPHQRLDAVGEEQQAVAL